MANDGSSGKWTINDERRFENFESRLDKIDETLRNLM